MRYNVHDDKPRGYCNRRELLGLIGGLWSIGTACSALTVQNGRKNKESCKDDDFV
jgi:hypothetical protein